MREVYLPLMSSCDTQQQGVSADKLLDLLHRLIGTMQVTNGLRFVISEANHHLLYYKGVLNRKHWFYTKKVVITVANIITNLSRYLMA